MTREYERNPFAMETPSNGLWELPQSLRALVEAELYDTEQVTWVGRPIARRFGLRGLPIVLFGIPWTAFALFWTAGAAGFKVPNFQNGVDLFPLFGVPFILVGVGMLSTPLWMVRKAKKTVYVLTNQRAIVITDGFSASIRSFSADRLTDLRRKQRPDGSGDLLFAQEHITDSSGRPTDYGFLAIAKVKRVEELVRQMAEARGGK